jgi:uncharacterized protein YutE (UPF0331/DUF86 family)
MSVIIEGFMEKKVENYINSIQEHIRECVEELDEYSRDLPKLVNKDFRGVERDLQILIEAGIGIAKRLVKKQNKMIPVGAYENFQKLFDLKFITQDELKKWASIIGLRNILVHDYLNVDRKVIQAILEKKEYRFIRDFMEKHISALG